MQQEMEQAKDDRAKDKDRDNNQKDNSSNKDPGAKTPSDDGNIKTSNKPIDIEEVR
jgi:hypothetical protein